MPKDMAQALLAEEFLTLENARSPLAHGVELNSPTERERYEKAGPSGLAMVGATVWTIGAAGAPLAALGAEALTSQPLALLGVAAAAIAPAAAMLFGSAALRESRRARQHAERVALMAREALLPTEETKERARSLSLVVRREIDTLNGAVQDVLDRFAQIEAAAARNAATFDQAVAIANDGAGRMARTLEQERQAFQELSAEMREQSDFLVSNVGRQMRLMRETSRMVRQEYESVEEAMTRHLDSLAASASIMTERTQDIRDAADAAHTVAKSMDESMGGALEALSQATSMTDAARQSVDQATLAANSIAGAVREVAQKAVCEARDVAGLIRGETQALEERAAGTLEKLRLAAEEARRASEEAYAAAERRAAQGPAASAPRAARPDVNPSVSVRPSPANFTLSPIAEDSGFEDYGRPIARSVFGGAGTDANVLPHPANDMDPFLVARSRALDVLARAGLSADGVFDAAQLDYVAAHARHGGAARRRAVMMAAPRAVDQLRRLFAADAAARAYAAEVRSQPELAAAPDSRDLLISYLVFDAALG